MKTKLHPGESGLITTRVMLLKDGAAAGEWQLGGRPNADLHLKLITWDLHKSCFYYSLLLFAVTQDSFGKQESVFYVPAAETPAWNENVIAA